MPRTVEVVLPLGRAEELLPPVRALEGVVAVLLQHGGAVEPPGDVLKVVVSNDAFGRLLELLRQPDGRPPALLTTAAVESLVVPDHQDLINAEGNETGWEELAALLRDETALSTNYLLLMALSGGVAAAGLWSNQLILVIAAQVIAPGFEPILRLPLGLITKSRGLAKVGAASTASGYLSMAVGAAATLGILALVEGPKQWAGNGLVDAFADIPRYGMVVSLLAATAGALALCTQKTVFFTGVLIALVLVPTTALAGMAVVTGRWMLAGRAFAHWSLDAAAVLVMGSLVLGLKQLFRHRRKSMA